jgi:hypothetical protein
MKAMLSSWNINICLYFLPMSQRDQEMLADSCSINTLAKGGNKEPDLLG